MGGQCSRSGYLHAAAGRFGLRPAHNRYEVRHPEPATLNLYGDSHYGELTRRPTNLLGRSITQSKPC